MKMYLPVCQNPILKFFQILDIEVDQSGILSILKAPAKSASVCDLSNSPLRPSVEPAESLTDSRPDCPGNER